MGMDEDLKYQKPRRLNAVMGARGETPFSPSATKRLLKEHLHPRPSPYPTEYI